MSQISSNGVIPVMWYIVVAAALVTYRSSSCSKLCPSASPTGSNRW